MQLGCPAVHRVVRSYFDDRNPFVLIMMTVGASHRYHTFLIVILILPIISWQHVSTILRSSTGQILRLKCMSIKIIYNYMTFGLRSHKICYEIR
jgi:hypothetical protein